MSYLNTITEMYAMIGEGKSMEALEKFYHDDVVVIDGHSEPRNGKAAQRKALQDWHEMIKETHGGGVGSITSDEKNGVTSVESWLDITFQNGKRIKIEEVGVQKWEGDQIVHERFYYAMPEGM